MPIIPAAVIIDQGTSTNTTCAIYYCLLLCSDFILQKVIVELEEAQNETKQLEESKKSLEVELRSTKKQLKAQELVSMYMYVTFVMCFVVVCRTMHS